MEHQTQFLFHLLNASATKKMMNDIDIKIEKHDLKPLSDSSHSSHLLTLSTAVTTSQSGPVKVYIIVFLL